MNLFKPRQYIERKMMALNQLYMLQKEREMKGGILSGRIP